MSRGFDYSKFDKIGDSDESSDDEDWKLTDEERKAKRERKRDELIEKELASHKAIEEKLKRAEKLPPRRSDDEGPPAPAAPAPADAAKPPFVRKVTPPPDAILEAAPPPREGRVVSPQPRGSLG